MFARVGLAGAKYMWECDKPDRPHRRLELHVHRVLLVLLYVHVRLVPEYSRKENLKIPSIA